jgi:hypothetical protein
MVYGERWCQHRRTYSAMLHKLEILRRLPPVDIHERTAQWWQEGWTGYDANAITSTPTSSAATTRRRAQEQARSTTRVADKGATTRCVQGQEEIARFLWWKKISP